MTEVNDPHETAVPAFRMSDWRADGTGELVAHGATPAAALAAVLNGVLAAQADDAGAQRRGGRSAPVRAAAPSLPALVSGLAASLLDLIDEGPDAFSEVTIDGMLRTDDGLTAWGFAAIARGTGATPVRVTMVGEPVVAETVTGVAITATLRRAGA